MKKLPKPKKTTAMGWGVYDDDGVCVDTAPSRAKARGLAGTSYRVARCRVTIMPA